MAREKSDEDLKRYYAIGEVAKRLGVKTSLIRFWENEFPHIRPSKDTRGNRRFTKDNIQQLQRVHYLVRERGFTLDGAKREIANAKQPNAEKQEIIDRLTHVRAKLRQLIAEG